MQCEHDGCRANAMKDDEYCYFHSQRPDIVQKRQESRKRGGSRGKLPRSDDIQSIDDVKRILTDTINELRSCGTDNTISKARAIGYLCGIMMTALERGDLEERITRLEELLVT